MNESTQTINSTPEEKGGRLFTQEQVNEIVCERLARQREQLADENEYKGKYEALKTELEGIKAAQAHQKKEAAYTALLKEAGVSEKRLATVLKMSAGVIDTLELDEHGKAVGADKMMEDIGKKLESLLKIMKVGYKIKV